MSPLTKEGREQIRARAMRPEPSLFGSDTVMALLDENDRLRSHLARAWAAWLDVVLDSSLEDGTPVLQVVLEFAPQLRTKLHTVLATWPTQGGDRT